jgi:hypothetical protein
MGRPNHDDERRAEIPRLPTEERLDKRGATMARQLERWAPLGGIIFVVLMVVGTYFVADVPDPDAPQQAIADYLGDSANHTRDIIGAYMWVLGALAFLWFVTRLRSVLRGAEGGTGTLSNLVFGAGVVYSALMMASGVTFAAVAYAIGFRDGTVSDPDFVRVLPQMAWMILLLGAGFAGLLLVLTASILSLQTGVLPRWLAWLGIVVAIVLLFDVIYVNIVPLLIWVLAASIVLLMRREDTATVAASPRERVA